MKKSTIKQKRLLLDIEKIREIAYRYSESIQTESLEQERTELIRNRILSDCVMLEEAMGNVIMNYILQDSSKWKSIKYFGRIKRFTILCDDILGHIPSFHKLKILNKFMKIPRKLEKTIRKLFDLRNTFAHTHTTDYTVAKKVLYNKKSIFEINAFAEYCVDFSETLHFFLKQIIE